MYLCSGGSLHMCLDPVHTIPQPGLHLRHNCVPCTGSAEAAGLYLRSGGSLRNHNERLNIDKWMLQACN